MGAWKKSKVATVWSAVTAVYGRTDRQRRPTEMFTYLLKQMVQQYTLGHKNSQSSFVLPYSQRTIHKKTHLSYSSSF